VPDVDVRRILDNLLNDRDDVAWGPNSRFKFPLLGTGMLYDRIAAGLPKPVQLGAWADTIDVAARQVVFADGSVCPYDHLVTTMPVNELVKRLDECPTDIREAALELRHTSGMFVGIGVADPCPSTKCWMYFPGADCPFYRVTYLSNYSPKMTPGPGHFSLLAEISASPFKVEDRSTIIQQTIDGMVATGLLTEEQAAQSIVSKQLLEVPYSYPVPTIGRDDALAVIQPWLMDQGIYSRGRFGAWRYEIGNTDHSVMMGVETADLLLSGQPETTWALLPGEEARKTIA
jgi:protoporphyrinogen oxidase